MSRQLRLTEKQLEDLAQFKPNSGRGVPKATTAEMRRQAEERREQEKQVAREGAAAIRKAVHQAMAPKKRSKYGAKPTLVDGIRFDSKLEAERYKELKLLVASGQVFTFVRQVRFALPGKSAYVADFVIFYRHEDGRCFDPTDGFAARVVVEDVKGHQTAMSKLKIRQMQDIYGIYVKLVRKAGK